MIVSLVRSLVEKNAFFASQTRWVPFRMQRVELAEGAIDFFPHIRYKLHSMKRTPSLFKKMAIAALAILGLCSFMTYGGASGTPGYKEIKVVRSEIHSFLLTTGRVQPGDRIDVKSPIPGRAEEIYVREGEMVTKGQILMRMSSVERAGILDAATVAGPAEYERWEKASPSTPVIAPATGRLIQRNIEPGQTFSEFDPVFVIADKLVIEAPVDEVDLAKIKKGDSCKIVLDADPKNELGCQVLQIAYDASISNNVTNYMVRFRPLNPSDFVRVGMTANVRLPTASKSGVLVIPTEALKSDADDLFVMVPSSSGGKAERRDVKLGLSDGQQVEVVAGLAEEEIVLVQKASDKSEKKKGILSPL